MDVTIDRESVSPVPGLTLGEAKDVWRNAAHPALQNRLKDLSWMVAHEILPVRAVMHSRGMAKNSTCPRSGCGFPETVQHLLWECGAARDSVGQDQPPVFPVPAGGSGPGGLQACHPGGVSGLEGVDTTNVCLALAHPQPYKGCHLGHQKPAGGETRDGPPPRVRAKNNINAAGWAAHRYSDWPPVDAPSPLWLREQRAGGEGNSAGHWKRGVWGLFWRPGVNGHS
ncbi:hypothetical protein F2P79_018086 [Pimephales promelas]|nr:hypothetical protein F2P79_018086 [Pimephales promelas]